MAIYSEEIDPNEIEKCRKDILIGEINSIIKECGNFSISDVEADHSPILETKGKLTHLGEEFEVGQCVVYVYDPTSYNSDEVDKYDEFYHNFEESQLEWILEMAETFEGSQDD